MKGKINSQGFGLIGALLVILVIAILGFGGWYTYHHNHKTKRVATSSSTKTTDSTDQSGGTHSAGTTPNPYSGWKSYCDTQHGYCFKYPADWSLESSTEQTSILNASKSAEVDYYNPYVHDGGLQPVDPVSVSNLNITGLDVKVVGVVYVSANQPYYGVVDGSKLSSYPLTVGQKANFPSPLSFADSHATSSSIVNFSARATSPMNSEQAAKDWFNSTDAKTSLLILESLSYQP